MLKKITIFFHMIPYPDTHGAKVDAWRRIVLMHSLGYSIQLICWTSDTLGSNDQAVIEEVCDTLIIIPIYRSFYKKCMKVAYSFYVSLYPAEIETYTNYKDLNHVVRSFGPDIIWLETYVTAIPAMKTAKRFDIPLYYRSHNVEYYYAKMITKLTQNKSVKTKIYRWLTEKNIKQFESLLRKNSDKIYEISIDDVKHWESLSIESNACWLPPLYTKKSSLHLDIGSQIDFLFIGNLFMENNIFAIKWLVEKVMPLVHKSIPKAKLLIIGSNPREEIIDYLNSYRYITCISDIGDIIPYLRKAKVVVNPTLHGSGITIKTIDGLYHSLTWVGTSQAFKGLPPEFYERLAPAKDAKQLAEQMITFYLNPDAYPDVQIQQLCEKYFMNHPKEILSGLYQGESNASS